MQDECWDLNISLSSRSNSATAIFQVRYNRDDYLKMEYIQWDMAQQHNLQGCPSFGLQTAQIPTFSSVGTITELLWVCQGKTLKFFTDAYTR